MEIALALSLQNQEQEGGSGNTVGSADSPVLVEASETNQQAAVDPQGLYRFF